MANNLFTSAIEEHKKSLSNVNDIRTDTIKLINEKNRMLLENEKILRKRAEGLAHENQELTKKMKINEDAINRFKTEEQNKLSLLEEKINILIEENEKLNSVLKDQYELTDDLKLNVKELETKLKNSHDGLTDRKQCEEKIDILQKKMEIIFEDYDNLERILQVRETDYLNLAKLHNEEAEKKKEMDNNMNYLLEKMNELNSIISNQAILINKYKEDEGQIENLLEQNKKLNEINFHNTEKIEFLQQENEQFKLFNFDSEEKFKALIEENHNLNNIIEKTKECNQNYYSETTDVNNENIIVDYEKKIEILLTENDKLHTIINEKLTDMQSGCEWEKKVEALAKENRSLKEIIKEFSQNIKI